MHHKDAYGHHVEAESDGALPHHILMKMARQLRKKDGVDLRGQKRQWHRWEKQYRTWSRFLDVCRNKGAIQVGS